MSRGGSKGTTLAKAREARRARRWKTGHLKCRLGWVVDLSLSGMRVRCTSKPPITVGQVFRVNIESSTQRLPVTVQALWVHRTGLRKHEVGVTFLNVSTDLGKALKSLGLLGFVDPKAMAAATQGAARPDTREQPEVQAELILPDYYEVLGVQSMATPTEIREAYCELAKTYHPQVTDSPDDQRKFSQITEAYEALRDPASRRNYNRQMFA